MNRIDIGKEWLEEQYYQRLLSYKEVAAILGCSMRTVYLRAKEIGIKARQHQGTRPKLDVVGKVFGSLTVLERLPRGNCLCACKCGETTVRYAGSLFRDERPKMCMSCRNQMISDVNWRGFWDISGTYLNSIIKGAKRRGISYEVDAKNLWDQFLRQDKKCAITGVELTFGRNKHSETTASLDRINSQMGYVVGNIQWIHKDLNKMKMDMDQNKFIEWCHKVSSYTSSGS